MSRRVLIVRPLRTSVILVGNGALLSWDSRIPGLRAPGLSTAWRGRRIDDRDRVQVGPGRRHGVGQERCWCSRPADNTGGRVQVARRQPDGTWLRVIDRPEIRRPE